MPTYQMIKALVNNVEDLNVDKDHLMIISPDEGALHRCIYFATQLGVNLGMFYKRRDYTRVVNGRNHIVNNDNIFAFNGITEILTLTTKEYKMQFLTNHLKMLCRLTR